MAQTILREFSDPVFLWFGALLVLLVMARKSAKRVRRYISLFLLVTLLTSNCFIAYQASRPLEEFGVNNFKYADASGVYGPFSGEAAVPRPVVNDTLNNKNQKTKQ